jgi:hypothetical protein
VKRALVGVLLATLAMYFFGFLFWGATTLPYRTWKIAPDDEAAQRALLTHFPESGTYHVPAPTAHDEKRRRELFERGPVGFVHIDRDGRPMEDPAILIGGFVLNLVVVALLALILWRVLPALPTYRSRVGFLALLGLTAAIMIDGGSAIWWGLAWQWKVVQGLYDVGAWIVAGLVLAKFIRPATPAEEIG